MTSEAAPPPNALWGNRIWIIELTSERASHRPDQIPGDFRLTHHHDPKASVDLFHLTPPRVNIRKHGEPADTTRPEQTYGHAAPLAREMLGEVLGLLAQLEAIVLLGNQALDGSRRTVARRGLGRGRAALSRQDEARLGDIIDALEAIRDHLTRGDLHDGLVYDAVRVRLIEIGESVKGIDPDILDGAPQR